MARPTKEEARGWALLVANRIENDTRPTEAELCALRTWLSGVVKALPSAAAVARDQQRKKARRSTTGPLPVRPPSYSGRPKGEEE